MIRFILAIGMMVVGILYMMFPQLDSTFGAVWFVGSLLLYFIPEFIKEAE